MLHHGTEIDQATNNSNVLFFVSKMMIDVVHLQDGLHLAQRFFNDIKKAGRCIICRLFLKKITTGPESFSWLESVLQLLTDRNNFRLPDDWHHI